MKYRSESDILGRVNVPNESYYGIETQRAINNFNISGIKVDNEFILVYAMIKKAAALANMKTGALEKRTGSAIVKACNDILSGKLLEQFPIDVFQAGAGTDTNMNLNEVIANRAIYHLKGKKGDYKLVHPNDHVNMSQSTNDTFHTAIHISSYIAVEKRLVPALMELEKNLKAKSRQFSNIIKIGRTHIQDAVPMRLGQEFSGYGGSVANAIRDIQKAAKNLLEIPIGGTAIGTGVNATKSYENEVVKEINKITKMHFFSSRNKFKIMSNQSEEIELSDSIKDAAIAINKIANDLRLLSSGPRAGIEEIYLPEVQPGSSIMPGKVNPSMAEMMNMVCFQVIGLDHTIEQAAEAGQLELNVFMPVIAYNLLFSIKIFSNAIKAFSGKCVTGIRADAKNIALHIKSDTSLATALVPFIGYAKAAKIARTALKQNKTVMQVCLEMKVLDKKRLEKILNPRKLVQQKV